jgi:hypothetical protein
MDITTLRPFHGYQSSIVPLAAGYYFYLASWDKTPTPFPHFTNIWLITPDNHRLLFADPPASSAIVCLYHEFDEILGAAITMTWETESHVRLRCASLDGGHKLEIDFRVQETLAAKVLLALAGGSPTPFRVSAPMLKLSDFLVNRIVAKGGSAIAGVTETGQPFYHGDTERLFQISACSAAHNGLDLGGRSRPTWPVTFGDAVPYVVPVLKVGTLYIPFAPAMLATSA